MLVSLSYIALVLLLVLANGFFVASEFALVAVRRSQVMMLVETGDRRARILLDLIDHLNLYISATQLGITISSLALGWIGEPAFARLLEAPLEGLVSAATRHTIAFGLAFTAITVLHIVIGELAPKTLALERAEKVALAIAWPLKIFSSIFRWPIRFLDWAGLTAVRLVGLRPTLEHASAYSVEELRHLIDTSRKIGTLEAEEHKLLHGVFEFSDAAVAEVMVPRNAMEALPASATLAETVQAFRSLGYSRLPVYRDQLDNILGVVYRRDLEPYREGVATEAFDLERLAHPPKFIPATVQLSLALRQMQASRSHMAFVIDEYGGIEGLVTLEDILEEIVGEIEDEYDEEESLLIVEEAGTYLLDGMLTVREVNQRLQLDLPEDEGYTTIAGFMLDRSGRLMNPEESIEFPGGRFTVESLDHQRIRRIRFTPRAPESD